MKSNGGKFAIAGHESARRKPVIRERNNNATLDMAEFSNEANVIN